MKNLLLFILTLVVLSCDKDDKPKTELEKLPPATQTGANTAGCLLDGKAFLPKGYSAIGNLDCNYIDGKDFSLTIAEIKSNKTLQVGIISDNKTLIVGETYQLKEYAANSSYGEFVIFEMGGATYETNQTITGEFKITNHNFNKAILSGTFWFDAINSEGQIVRVRDGRFDMLY